MKFVILALFLACISCQELFLPVNTIPQNFTSCQSNALITITKAIAMSVPEKGQNITFILLGTVSGLVQLQEVMLAVQLEGVAITTFTFPCTSVFSPGQTFEYRYVQFIPSYAPSGSYTLHYEYMDITGKQDGCTQVLYTLN